MTDEPQSLDNEVHNCWASRDLDLMRLELIELRKRISPGYESLLTRIRRAGAPDDAETLRAICMVLVAERDAALAREDAARKLLAEALAKAPPTEEPPDLTVLAHQESTITGHQLLRVRLKWGANVVHGEPTGERELVLPGFVDRPTQRPADILDGVRRVLEAALAAEDAGRGAGR